MEDRRTSLNNQDEDNEANGGADAHGDVD